MKYKSATAFESIEIKGMNAESRNFNLASRRSRHLIWSVPGYVLAAVPWHLLHPVAGGSLLSVLLVYAGVSALCSVAPYAAALIALTLLYLRASRRHVQRENHRFIWLRIAHAIGRDSRVYRGTSSVAPKTANQDGGLGSCAIISDNKEALSLRA